MFVTRNVALADETYIALAARKRRGQSFNDVVEDLLRAGRPSLAEVAGSATDPGWDDFAAERRAGRAQTLARVDLDL